MKKVILIITAVLGLFITNQAQAQFPIDGDGIATKEHHIHQENFIGVGELQECTFADLEFSTQKRPSESIHVGVGELQDCTLIHIETITADILSENINIGVGELQECTFKNTDTFGIGELQECTYAFVQLDKSTSLFINFNQQNKMSTANLAADVMDYLDDYADSFGEWDEPMEVPFRVLQEERPEGTLVLKRQ